MGTDDQPRASAFAHRERSDRNDHAPALGRLCGEVQSVFGFFKIDEEELAGPTRRLEIARDRALVGLVATRDLSISGSAVARRLNVDRSAISRAVQRAGNDPDLMAAAE
jgi:hypothetical protein